MKITIIDGQGGQLGAQLVKVIAEEFPDAGLTAIGTNAVATATMLKAGAKNAEKYVKLLLRDCIVPMKRLSIPLRLRIVPM